MMTRFFLLTIFLLVSFLTLTSCVTERTQTKAVQKRVYIVRTKQGPLRFEVQGSETILNTELKFSNPGFYQVALSNGNSCPAANTVLDPSLFYEQSDAFYVSDQKPQAIIRQFNRFLPNGTAFLIRKDEDKQTLVSCAPLPVSKK